MPDPTSDPVSRLPPTLPPRPQCRANRRLQAACVWTVVIVFFAALGYVGDLALTRNAGQSQPNPGIGGHVFLGVLLVGCTIAAVISVISRRHHR